MRFILVKLALYLMAILSLLNNLQAKGLEVGATLPKVTSTDHDGREVTLAELAGDGTAVIFFYPKADTPGCTKQACSLRDGWSDLTKRGVRIIGVSSDRSAAQQRFREKYSLPFTLLADADQEIARAFNKSRWSRQAYLFKDSKLVWRDLKASTAGQLDDVLAALDQLED